MSLNSSLSPADCQVGIALAAWEPDTGYLRQQLDSIVAQTSQNWLCVIRLDSPLSPLQEDSGLEKFFKDERFFWIENNQRLGHKKNFEAVMADVAAKGVRWIFLCDQDDVWVPEKIEQTVEALHALPSLSLVHSDMTVFSGAGLNIQSIWDHEGRNVANSSPTNFLIHNLITGAASALDAELARKYHVIPSSVDFHDHWLGLLASCNGGVYALKKSLVSYRQHERNVIGAKQFYGGFFPQKGGFKAAAARALRAWEKTWQLKNSIQQAGLSLPIGSRILTSLAPDFGLGFLVIALANLSRDKKFSRECFIRSVGKALWCLRGGRFLDPAG